MRLGICQIKTRADKRETLDCAEEMLRYAAGQGAELLILPEMFQCPYHVSYFRDYAENARDGITLKRLAKLARDCSVYIIGGSIPEEDDGRIYNTSFSFDPQGEIIGRHRKVHLFDIDVPGGITFRESDVLTAGDDVTVIDTRFGKIGVAICFDTRFPELMRCMALRGAKLIVAPSAYNMTTGPAHWEITARMRALDNQLFFAFASTARDMDFSYHAYGHSMVVNPWGDIVASLDEKPGVLIADIDLNDIERYRTELPIMRSRREDVYNKTYPG